MRTPVIVAVLAVAAALLAKGAVSAPAQVSASITVRGSAYGRILFDGRGFALYAFTRDRARHSACAHACARKWPPFIVAEQPRAGRGAKAALVGTIRRGNGRLQVTYRGRPLYRYIGDRKPLQVLCQNVSEFGGLWLVVRPNGTLVR
jgi:predicted lipoprotein with Yx(FWY)xxD motif